MSFFFGKKHKDESESAKDQPAEGGSVGSWFSRHFGGKSEAQQEQAPVTAAAPEETAKPEESAPAAAQAPAGTEPPAPVKTEEAPLPAETPAETKEETEKEEERPAQKEVPAPVPAPKAEPEKESWFSRLRKGLTKTRVNLYGLFSGGVVDEDFLEELQDALIASDTGLPVSEEIIEKLRTAIKLQGLKTRSEVRTELVRIVADMLRPSEKPLDIGRTKPLVIMMAGVNGAGKTTSIGKISKWLAQNNKSVLLAAGDTFRAAAREQLEVWGERNSVHVVSQQGADPAAVIFDAVSSARSRGIDVVLADTAGRLPTQAHLMEELTRIKRSQNKALPGAPHEVILVIDGTNGQNAVAQVRQFDEAVGLTGLIVTKLDGTAKGGVLLAITKIRGGRPLPIYFIGVGEKIDDLQPFSAEEFAQALIGAEETPGALN